MVNPQNAGLAGICVGLPDDGCLGFGQLAHDSGLCGRRGVDFAVVALACGTGFCEAGADIFPDGRAGGGISICDGFDFGTAGQRSI